MGQNNWPGGESFALAASLYCMTVKNNFILLEYANKKGCFEKPGYER